MRNYKRKAKSSSDWWRERLAEEKTREERLKKRQELDELLQNWTIYKERAEDFCNARFERYSDGTDFIQLRSDENMFDAINHIVHYDRAVKILKKHIPNLEYDPRISDDCPYEYAIG